MGRACELALLVIHNIGAGAQERRRWQAGGSAALSVGILLLSDRPMLWPDVFTYSFSEHSASG